MKKDQTLPNKKFTVTTLQANHFLTIIMSLDSNHPTDITNVEDLRIKEFHEISHGIDIVDQTVKTIDIEIIIQDQIQTEATIRTSLKTVPVLTLVIHTIQTIDLEIPHTKETEIIQIKETDSIKIRDHETIQTMNQTTIDQITTIITLDQVTILKIEIRIIVIDKEFFLSITAQK